jgi:inorganic pyrophosphatase
MNLYKIQTNCNSPEIVNVVVEIPKGTSAKYEYDPLKGVFVLDRMLHSAMVYPANYGFIPNTIAADGDALDAVIYCSSPIDRGTMVECVALGSLNMTDDGVKDYKILCVPTSTYERHSTMKDVDTLFLDVTRNFFQHYKDLDNREVVCGKWHGKNRAHEIIVNDTIVDLDDL